MYYPTQEAKEVSSNNALTDPTTELLTEDLGTYEDRFAALLQQMTQCLILTMSVLQLSLTKGRHDKGQMSLDLFNANEQLKLRVMQFLSMPPEAK